MTSDYWHRSQGRLAGSLETAQLREQFISILGHDLRNPLASLQVGTGTPASRAGK